jgi:hypothetical protein
MINDRNDVSPDLHERLARVEQRQADMQAAFDAKIASIRFWGKVLIGLLGTLVLGPLTSWTWGLIKARL